MRLSYEWLQDYVDVSDITPEELAARLTDAGIAVDVVEPRNQGVEGIVVGEVVACEPHPNADRLKVCQVNVGGPELLNIVCGAPNVRQGHKVVTALVGARLPGITIKKAKLRGVESAGMLCSATEIGLETRWLPKEQTEGLYILPSDAPVGEDAVSYLHLNDVILELDLTPNRSDCLSMRGIAYEVGAILNRPVQFASESLLEQGESPVSVTVKTPLCTRYEAQVVEGLAIAPAPLWMQMRLLAAGVRPINNIVDVTNYVMLEWGQPLHAFDLDQVHDHHIVVRQAEEGELLVTLDGVKRDLFTEAIVISDPDRAIGIAGVMGGENSEVTSDTRRVVLESAVFDPATTRRTGQRLGLRSEAQQRFEKGIDPVAVRGALTRATALFQELAGAVQVGQVAASGNAVTQTETQVEFSPERSNARLGTSLSEMQMQEIFDRLGFTVQRAASGWTVGVPTRRPDISIEADLVEEVGRLAGYHQIPSTLPVGPTTVGMRTASQRLRKRTRELLVGFGVNEVFTYTFSHPSALDPLRIPESSPYRRMIPLLRPMSEERTVLRTHLLPGLAQVAGYNLAHGVAGGAIFEIGRVFWPKSLPLTEQPEERTQLAGLWFGETEPQFGQRTRLYDFFDAKGCVEGWLDALGLLPNVQFEKADDSWLHPGRSAQVLLSGELVGQIGELHPETAETLSLGRTVYVEFDLDALTEHWRNSWRIQRLPRFPASRRDLAVVVQKQVPVANLLQQARQVAVNEGIGFLESCQVFDVFEGKSIPEGQKSVAVSFVYRSDERTLTDEEINAFEAKVLEAWGAAFGATLRA